MTCQQCRYDDDAREEWGCDNPTRDPLVELECYTCDGSGWIGKGVECTTCVEVDGGRCVPHHRCPWSVLPVSIHRVVQSACAYDAHGTLPSAGGWEDQPVTWQTAVGLLLAERRSYDEDSRERSQLEAEARR